MNRWLWVIMVMWVGVGYGEDGSTNNVQLQPVYWNDRYEIVEYGDKCGDFGGSGWGNQITHKVCAGDQFAPNDPRRLVCNGGVCACSSSVLHYVGNRTCLCNNGNKIPSAGYGCS